MKKYIISCAIIIFVILSYFFIRYNTSFHFISSKEPIVIFKSENKKLYQNDNEINIHGVNLSDFIPNETATKFNIKKDTYKKWFQEMEDMNANCVRVYTIMNPDFYNALKEFNDNSEEPLYLIQGIDFDKYSENSKVDYYDDSLYKTMQSDMQKMIDVIHGNRYIGKNKTYANGFYLADVSSYTIGYIIGTEWDADTIVYTNMNHESDTSYEGKYLQTTSDASPFERLLTSLGDKAIQYESEKYESQRLLSFGNYPFTDPFTYDAAITDYYNKIVTFDLNHIEPTSSTRSGLFASFEAYSGYPDYYRFESTPVSDTYKAYLQKLVDHSNYPLVISQFGYSTSRGVSFSGTNYEKNNLNEDEQGEMLVKALNTMKSVGINNMLIYEWQDDWSKNSWNTLYETDTTRSKYWHDVQTYSQSYGLLSFDNNANDKVYVDGNTDEWTDDNIISSENGLTLSSKYDSEYIYFLIHKDGLNLQKDTIYIPIDTLNNIGSTSMDGTNLSFDHNVDFVLQINGEQNSKLLVSKRYNSLDTIYGSVMYNDNPYETDNIPSADTNVFTDINMIEGTQKLLYNHEQYDIDNIVSLFNTGKLVYGNSNPTADNYNSLGDFYSQDNNIEIRIPWALLNFSDSQLKRIHDDYYLHYGVETKNIFSLYAGIGSSDTIHLHELKLNTNTKINSIERLKKSYYVVKDFFGNN